MENMTYLNNCIYYLHLTLIHGPNMVSWHPKKLKQFLLFKYLLTLYVMAKAKINESIFYANQVVILKMYE